MKLYLLQYGLLQPVGIPIPGYLIQTDDGTNVLVDTGFPYGFIENPPGAMGPLALQAEMRPEDYVVSRLHSIGLIPDDIHFLVTTHFDIDHAGNNALFTQAEHITQQSHYEAAQGGHMRSGLAREQWGTFGLRYRLVEGDTTLLPGVELLESGGHVPGHQAVLVRLPHTGPVLLAIDAIPTAEQTDPDTRVVYPNDEDEAGTRESTRKLMEIARRENVALIVHGHDAAQWKTLRHAPAFYD